MCLFLNPCLLSLSFHVSKTCLSNCIFVAAPPTFIERPRDQKVGLNGVVEFNCAATGNPPPSVFWSKEGSQLLMFPDNAYGHMHVNSHGTLRIQGVQREDAGFLVCSALSVAGSNSVRAFLQVRWVFLLVGASVCVPLDFWEACRVEKFDCL